MTCPHCHRPTWFPSRAGRSSKARPAFLHESIATAMVSDGTCRNCWRIVKKRPHQSVKGIEFRTTPTTRHEITDAEVRQVRRDLLKLRAARRRRGIPKEGLHPSVLVRPGLMLLEA